MAPHVPVLLEEVTRCLRPRAGARFLDGTFGAGGYAIRLLEEGATLVIGLDRDPSVQPHAERLSQAFGARFRFHVSQFSRLADVLEAEGLSELEGIVLDIGVSSMQLDQAVRGFSFQADGPLDMRMGAGAGPQGPSAADVLAAISEEGLAQLLRAYGEEPQARRIAKAIVAKRAGTPLTTTGQLADVVEGAVGGRKGARLHPATRTFQALRIFVNDELGELARGLEAAERVLSVDGVLAVVSFHSLEDRVVKAFFRTRSKPAARPSRHLPETQSEGPSPSFRLAFNRVMTASEEECLENPRARSAKLRAGLRTDAPAFSPDLAPLPLPKIGATLCDFSPPSS